MLRTGLKPVYCFSCSIFAEIHNTLSLTIHTNNLVKTYGSRTVVNNVSVEVKQGEIVGLLGPNGAGKTTTFYMVVGLIKPDEGEVFLNTEEITKQPMYKRAKMGIGYLPQEASVFRKLSVEDNILAVLEMTKLSKAERLNKLDELLDEFNLKHVRKNNGDSLSGGERRRTEIARALAVDPKFILLDEPFAGVDPIAVEDIQTVVARLKYKNIGILITDHNVNETLSICDRAYLLIDGKIFKHGTAEELAENEQVKRLYLGTNFELKRKDWIIDLGKRDKKTDALHAVIVALERAEKEHHNKQQQVQDSQYTGALDNVNPLTEDDLQLKEYTQFLSEIKSAILNYGKEYNDAEIVDKAMDLFNIDVPGVGALQNFRSFLQVREAEQLGQPRH